MKEATHTIEVEGWYEDAAGVNAWRPKGERIAFRPGQADYLELSGLVAPVPAPAPVLKAKADKPT